jgi:hypothetical protein
MEEFKNVLSGDSFDLENLEGFNVHLYTTVVKLRELTH